MTGLGRKRTVLGSDSRHLSEGSALRVAIFLGLRKNRAINVVQISRLYLLADGAFNRSFGMCQSLERLIVQFQACRNQSAAFYAPYAEHGISPPLAYSVV